MVKYGKQIYTISKHLQVVGCSDEAAYEQIVVTVHLTSASCLNRPWKMELTSCWRTQQISTRRSRWDDMNVPRTSLGRSAHHWCYVKELSSDPNDNRCLSYFITVCITHVHPCHRHDHDHHRHHHPRPHPHPASPQIGSSVFKKLLTHANQVIKFRKSCSGWEIDQKFRAPAPNCSSAPEKKAATPRALTQWFARPQSLPPKKK